MWESHLCIAISTQLNPTLCILHDIQPAEYFPKYILHTNRQLWLTLSSENMAKPGPVSWTMFNHIILISPHLPSQWWISRGAFWEVVLFPAFPITWFYIAVHWANLNEAKKLPGDCRKLPDFLTALNVNTTLKQLFDPLYCSASLWV